KASAVAISGTSMLSSNFTAATLRRRGRGFYFVAGSGRVAAGLATLHSDVPGEAIGHADVTAWRHVQQALPGIGRQVQGCDEFAHRGLGDALSAGQCLQLFVRIGQAMAAHYRLHGFGQDFPGGIEVGGKALGIDAELVQAALQRLEADQHVAERGAQRAQHGRIGEVALPAADRQLGGKVFEQRAGDAEVAFGVLEVDRVDLVRHGRAADFAGLDGLLEVTLRDVAPDVAAQVDGDGIDALGHVAQLGDAVVRFDLGGVGLPGEIQRFDEATRERGPVDVGIRGDVGVVVAYRAVDL